MLDGTAPENRVEMTAELLIALFVGLSVPMIGARIALDQGASAPNTVLGFAVLVGLGVAGAGWGLLGHRPKSSPQAAGFPEFEPAATAATMPATTTTRKGVRLTTETTTITAELPQ